MEDEPTQKILWSESSDRPLDQADVEPASLYVVFAAERKDSLAMLTRADIGWLLECPSRWKQTLHDEPEVDAALVSALETAIDRIGAAAENSHTQ
jgi:hypothetical protein